MLLRPRDVTRLDVHAPDLRAPGLKREEPHHAARRTPDVEDAMQLVSARSRPLHDAEHRLHIHSPAREVRPCVRPPAFPELPRGNRKVRARRVTRPRLNLY